MAPAGVGFCRQASLAGAWRLRSLTRPRRHCDGKAGGRLLGGASGTPSQRRPTPALRAGAFARGCFPPTTAHLVVADGGVAAKRRERWLRRAGEWPPGGGRGGSGGGGVVRTGWLAGAWRLRSLTRPRRHCDSKAGCRLLGGASGIPSQQRPTPALRTGAFCGASFRQRPLTSWSRTVAWPPGGGRGGSGGRWRGRRAAGEVAPADVVWPRGGGRGGFGGRGVAAGRREGWLRDHESVRERLGVGRINHRSGRVDVLWIAAGPRK